MKTIRLITTVLILITSFTTLFAQADNTEIAENKLPESLTRSISIDLSRVTLEDALTKISDLSGIKFNYSADYLPLEKIVSVNMENVPAAEALMKVLNDTGTGMEITNEGFLILTPALASYAQISGTVVDGNSGSPLIGANVIVKGTQLGSAADLNGRFLIPRLVPGVYSLEASMIGYGNKTNKEIILAENEHVEVNFELDETTLSLSEIVVTPGYFSLIKKNPASNSSLSSRDVQNFPHLGEDIYRAVKRLPGLASNDMSAKFSIRGGEYHEVLVQLDGMELHDPFHLKDFTGILSIVDVEIIDNIDIVTGAFPAEYGNRLSGVYNMKTGSVNTDKPKTSFGISLMNTRLFSEGSFDDRKGSWQLLARRGYIDYLLQFIGEDDKFKPVYYDLYSKVQYFLNPDHLLSAHFLASDDDFRYDNEDDDNEINSKYKNIYGWLKWEAQLRSNLSLQTVVSKSSLTQERNTKEVINSVLMNDSFDDRETYYYEVKQNWVSDLSDRFMLKWGFDFKRLYGDYNYKGREKQENDNHFDETAFDQEIEGDELAFYLSGRFRLLPPLVTEIGLRYDKSTLSGDKTYSPRVNLAYNLNNKMTLRAGWGKFYQTMGIHRLNVIDLDNSFYSANLAKQRNIGLEYLFDNNINLRIEAYHKELADIRPRYDNYRFYLSASPEFEHDRIKIDPERGVSKGFEIFLFKDKSSKHNWWMNYVYSVVEEKIDGKTVPRNMDQRHSFNFDYNYLPNNKWAFNIAIRYHTGWPFTEDILYNVRQDEDGYYDWDWKSGELNGKRTPSYQRIDLKASRYFNTSRGRISAFIEVVNLLNRINVREYNYDINYISSVTDYRTSKTAENWMPRLPSFGVSWEF